MTPWRIIISPSFHYIRCQHLVDNCRLCVVFVFLSNGLIVPPPLFCWRGCNFTAFAYTQQREREREGRKRREGSNVNEMKRFQPIRDKGGEREPGRAGVAADLTAVDPWKHSQQQKLFKKTTTTSQIVTSAPRLIQLMTVGYTLVGGE